ncbi:MAG TPA: 16S rRNA (cytosine(1402)-N(4))-methyltransferase RsmH [Candidatus Azoamicus sp.]
MHNPVMLKEAMKFLDLKPDGLYLDLTYGIGGHSNEISKYLNKYGTLISIDKDILSYTLAKKTETKCNIFKMSFNEFKNESNFSKNIDGIILDLGLSLDQIKDAKMGLSFYKNSHLDMRLDKKQKLRASDWINVVNEIDLKIFFNFFIEENISNILLKNIIKFRKKKKIKTSKDLCYIIIKSLNQKDNLKNISKIFTLIKILINNELFLLSLLLNDIKILMTDHCNLIIITFNSFEDKIVKNYIFNKNNLSKFKHIFNRPEIKELNKNYPSRNAIMHILKKN